jgi:hypothetical protein
VISKKKNYRFSERIRTFYRKEKPIFTKKKFPPLCQPSAAVLRDFMAVQMEFLSARLLKDAFKLETSTFGSLKELV